MRPDKKTIGAWGEQAASDWLKERGYCIVARNIRTPYGEIDIVAELDNVTIFVEVKTLTTNAGYLPEEKITFSKQRHMLNCAEYYCSEHGIDHWQIDAVAVEGSLGHVPSVTHFPNIL